MICCAYMIDKLARPDPADPKMDTEAFSGSFWLRIGLRESDSLRDLPSFTDCQVSECPGCTALSADWSASCMSTHVLHKGFRRL